MLVAGTVLAVAGGAVLAGSAAAGGSVDAGVVPASDLGHGRTAGSTGPPPRSLQIASLGIAAGITAVHPTASGELAVPDSFTAVGWWGGRPGADATTPAVLVGHVDDHHGPAVFYRLARIRPGADVAITTDTGQRLHYVVDGVRQYADSHFPGEQVYGATDRPTLRLMTCGGYSWLRRHYEDNVVVFAHLASSA